MGSKKIMYCETSRWKYQLLRKFKIQLDKTFDSGRGIDGFIFLNKAGLLTIYKGYCWDGASGPTIDTKSTMRASLVHDALYQLMRAGKLKIDYRDWADRWLRDLGIKDGMFRWRAWAWYYAVRRFSEKYAKPQKEYDIHYAP